MTRNRVLLADDHQMLADALRIVLEPHCEVVGLVNNGRALMEAAAKLRPDIIVLDIDMPHLNGFEAGRQIKQVSPSVKLIFMTMHEEPFLVEEAFRAGASAFLLKEAAASELTLAIERVSKDGSYLTARSARSLAELPAHMSKTMENEPEPTSRQREVIQLLAEGHAMKEIAEELKITIRTVAGHKYGVMKNLKLKSNAALVQYAVRKGIIYQSNKSNFFQR